MNSTQLHETLIRLSSEERRITLEVIRHLREVDSRKLYAARGHSSLFEYVTRELGYSEGSAQRRIQAMRAVRELPELAPKLESGELKVTQVAQIQTVLRKTTLSAPEKQEIFHQAIGNLLGKPNKCLLRSSQKALWGESSRSS